MRYYQPNPACGCGRCSTRGLMGPAVLVTLGLLFLLANMSDYPFHRTWPILLIVMGAIKVVCYVIPDSGHINPGQFPPPSNAVQYPPPPYQGGAYATGAQNAGPAREPVVTPPPAPSAGALGDGKDENGEAHNG
jgi:Domain of unknown function (DUF5668)